MALDYLADIYIFNKCYYMYPVYNVLNLLYLVIKMCLHNIKVESPDIEFRLNLVEDMSYNFNGQIPRKYSHNRLTWWSSKGYELN